MSALDALNDRIYGKDGRDWFPYVWKLKISAAEFAALENAVNARATKPLQNVVYLAEWYKRRYDGGTSKPVRDDFDCRELFEQSGIDQANNLFQTEGGIKTWQYSIFVLGGVAIPFELGKNDKRFLEELCRIYYGEDGDVDQLGDKFEDKNKERAVAFRESVRTRGSLYEYLQAILSGDPPFAADDLADANSPENSFIERIKSANREVLKSKFDLEWLIGFDPVAEHMTRKLRLALKPESLGGLNHQYLKFERVRLWGIAPETCRRIAIGVRFLLGNEVVEDPAFDNPILEYSATGSRNAGFVAWHTERFSRKADVPVEKFNGVEIVARDDQGEDHVVERFPVATWMQVFRVPDGHNEWTSRHFSQRDSAVICPESFEMLDVGPTEAIHRKRFWRKGDGVSDPYQWRAVYDRVRFRDDTGREFTIFNRQGYDQIVPRLHHDILRYQNGCVSYIVRQDEEEEETLLPLVFGKDDLVVRHFESRNDMADAPISDGAVERVEFLDGGCYREWTETEAPKQGKAALRVTVKGIERKLVVYHLPVRIARDCDAGRIVCGDEQIEDRIVRDGTPTDPVVLKKLGTDEEFVSLEIWRATKHKEIIRDGKVVRYVEDGETAGVSYILKDGLEIHDFSAEGYREYNCGDIHGIYSLETFSPANNSHLAALTNQAKVQVSATLDCRAPKWLWINLATDVPASESAKMLYWNYLSDVEPKEVGEGFACVGNDIAFQSLKGFEGTCVRSPQLGKYNAFRLRPLMERVDLVKCFELATADKVYYFAMLPLRLPNANLRRGLYEPLVAKRKGMLDEEDRRGLLRLAEEFGFDWREKYEITIS